MNHGNFVCHACNLRVSSTRCARCGRDTDAIQPPGAAPPAVEYMTPTRVAMERLAVAIARISSYGRDSFGDATGRTSWHRLHDRTADLLEAIERDVSALGMSRMYIRARRQERDYAPAEWAALLVSHEKT